MVLAIDPAELLRRFLFGGGGLLKFAAKVLKRGKVVNRERDAGMFATEQAPPKVDHLAVQGGGFLVATLLSSEDGLIVERLGNQVVLVAVERFSGCAAIPLRPPARVGQPAALARRVLVVQISATSWCRLPCARRCLSRASRAKRSAVSASPSRARFAF
jgi:hypothetical protein